MKTVWVKHNNFGQLLPMSEWKPFCASDDATHIVHYFNKFMVCSKDPEAGNANKQRGEILSEYIGNQRGDGWFYVADGDLPPIEDNAILCHDDAGVRLMMPVALHLPNTWEYQNKIICWQPINSPTKLNQSE